MRKAILSGLALAFLFTASGCGDNIESAAREEIKLTDQKAAVLEQVKDRESAEEARARLEKINEERKQLEERLKKLTKDQKPEKVLAALLALRDAEDKARERLREARTKALQNKDAAAALKGIDLD